MGNAFRSEFQLKYFGFADTKPEKFYVSEWFQNRIAFVGYRVFMFLYCLIWSINTTIILVPHYPQYYGYLSDWSEWSLVIYFGIALGVAIYGLTMKETPEESRLTGCCTGSKICQDNLRWFHRLCWVVFNAVMTINIVVTVLFWALLSGFPVKSQVANIHQHVMNTVLMVTELFVVAFPMRVLHFIYPMMFGLTYMLFTLILHAAAVMSRYYQGFLDWQSVPGLSAGIALGSIFVACPIGHAIAFGLYHLRSFIARKVQPQGGVDENRDIEAGGGVNPAFDMTESSGRHAV